MAEILTRYTLDFLIYTEKSNETHNYGLGYSVVIKLMGPLLNQRYHVLFDKFYTSVKFLNDWLSLGTHECDTPTEDRDGILEITKNGKELAKMEACRDVRWSRVDHCLCVQCVEKKL